METIFSVQNSREVTDATIPVEHSDSLPSLHLPTAPKFNRSSPLDPLLGQDHLISSHLSINPDPVLSISTCNAHMMRFTEPLSLPSMKSLETGPLMPEDEDDDMRSLLDAAAAVAASVAPESPHLRSSSSGLNTPPDTRICRPLDDEHVGDAKVDLENSANGLHTRGGAALLVSRLHSAAAYSSVTDDPMEIHVSKHSSVGNYCASKSAGYTDLPSATPTSLTPRFFSVRSPVGNDSTAGVLGTLKTSPSNSMTQTVQFPPSNDVFLSDTFTAETSSPSTPPTLGGSHLKTSGFTNLLATHSPTIGTPPVTSDIHSTLNASPKSLDCGSCRANSSVEAPQNCAEISLMNTPPTCEDLFKTSKESVIIQSRDALQADAMTRFPTTQIEFPSSPNTAIESTDHLKTPVLSPMVPTDVDPPVSFLKSENHSPSIQPEQQQIFSREADSNSKVEEEVQDCVTLNQKSSTPPVPEFSEVPEADDLDAKLGKVPSIEPKDPSFSEQSVLDSDVEPVELEALIKSSGHLDRQPESPEELLDESEYVSAAVAAVEDVVFALAGNRKPDPSLAVDPTLEGTGTDRIYTLNLAPIATDMSFNSQSSHSSQDVSQSMPINMLQLNPSTISYRTHSVTPGPSLDARQAHASDLPSSVYHQSPNASPRNDPSDSSQSKPKWSGLDVKGEFPCTACNRVFPQRALLLKHRVMHDEPKHTCPTCGRCFVREDKLKRHVMSIHTTEKPHICNICGKAFSRKDKLKDHLKHHERAARNFECLQCQQRFVQKSDLNRHIRGVHQGEPGVGINMGTKRRASGTTPLRMNKKKTKGAFIMLNGCSSTRQQHSSEEEEEEQTFSPPASSTSSAGGTSNMFTLSSAIPTLNSIPTMTQTCHPMFSTGASGLMIPAMTLTQAAQHQLVQQQQHQAAAAAALMLPSATANHPSTALQQQQHFFAVNATSLSSTSQHQAGGSVAQAQLQPELKAVATPAGPMMVLTRIAAATQAGQMQQLASHAVFPQMVGFPTAGPQSHQLQQLQQQAVIAHQQQQLFQQQQAVYSSGAQLVAVPNQPNSSTAGSSLVASANYSAAAAAAAAHQFQLQQQQVAAFAARQQAHGFLFPTAANTPASFFCHPSQDGMAAGLFLASSADPASFALAAAAAAAQQQQQQQQHAVGYTVEAAQQHQQLLLQQQQQQQQRLAALSAVAAAAAANPQTSCGTTTTTTTSGSSSSQDPQPAPSSTALTSTSHPDAAVAMNNCYQLAAALYQQHHPGFMLSGGNPAMAAMALQHQQYQQQQQQAGLMAAAAYQQHQQQQQQLLQSQALQQQSLA